MRSLSTDGSGEGSAAAADGGETKKWKFEDVKEIVEGVGSGGDKGGGRVLIGE